MTPDPLARRGRSRPRVHSSHFEHVLGTSLDLRWVSGGWWAGRLGRRIERAVLAEIRRLDQVFSTFREDSELSRWQDTRGTAVLVSPELADLLEAAERWRVSTRGAFDPRARPGTAVPDLRDDDPSETPLWEVECTGPGAPPTARKLTPDPVSLDAIAKGYIVDRACAEGVRAGGGTDVMVNLGGDVRHIGEGEVTVGVTDPFADAENAPPLDRVSIRDQAVATSGGYRRGTREGESWRSHLVDPLTGRSVERLSSASVIAPSCATADVLATAFSVLEPEACLLMADRIPGVGCLLVRASGERLSNDVWNRHRVADGHSIGRREMLSTVLASGLWLGGSGVRRPPGRLGRRVQWDESFELVVSFDFGDPRSGRNQRRPYVVVYIDDAEGDAVRTVGLWAQKAGWIRELRRWMRGERARQSEHGGDLVATLTAPTRSPGHYTVVWDGRDDQGEWVEQGEYFVCLETIRQGSSSYVTRQPFTFESTPFQAEMEDYGAFRDIRLDFRRRG